MRKRIEKAIIQSDIYQRLKYKTDNTYLKDKETNLSEVILILIRKIKKDEMHDRANAVAFNLTLSVFPAIIFLFTLIPYIPIPDLDQKIMEFLGQVLPFGIYKEAASTVYDIVSRPRANLLSLGFIFTLYVATNGMIALMDAFNKSYRTGEHRGFIKKRMIAVLLTFIIAFVLFIAVAILIIGNIALSLLIKYEFIANNFTYYFISFLQYFTVFFVFFIAISFIYYIAPTITKRWTFFSVGSVIAAILCILVTHLFSYYLSNFATYNKLYGSIGTFIGVMIWFYLLSLIMLLGFEINASIDEAKYN